MSAGLQSLPVVLLKEATITVLDDRVHKARRKDVDEEFHLDYLPRTFIISQVSMNIKRSPLLATEQDA